jgi:hypothetical protein
MTDEEFLRHLHRQLEDQKRDQGLTTLRSLERQKKIKSQKKIRNLPRPPRTNE